MHQENKLNLSIVIPVFNEEQYIKKLFLDLKKYFNQEDIEIIVVNDGSNDSSYKLLEDLKKNSYKFKYKLINLSNNFGKTSSMPILNKLKQIFLSYGYKVKINQPFKGGFITRYYGKPQNNIHFIQIEINKNLYLFESHYKIKKKKFENLKNCFLEIINYINIIKIK